MMLYMLMKQIMQPVVNNRVNLILNMRVVLYGATLFSYNKKVEYVKYILLYEIYSVKAV